MSICSLEHYCSSPPLLLLAPKHMQRGSAMRIMQSTGKAHQFRMSPFRLAHMDSPAVVSPHCVGYREEHWMPHVAFVHTRVPLQSCSELRRFHRKDSSRLASLSWIRSLCPCTAKSIPRTDQLGALDNPWVPCAPLRVPRFQCRTYCLYRRGRSCCRTRRSWGWCSGWRRTCRCWSCTPSDRLPSTAPCNSLQAAARMLAGVGRQASILLGIGISAIPLQVALTHYSAHTHLQCAPWAREVLD